MKLTFSYYTICIMNHDSDSLLPNMACKIVVILIGMINHTSLVWNVSM